MHRTYVLILLTVANAKKMSDDIRTLSKQEAIKDNSRGANEVKSARLQEAVDFGHIYRHGVGDVDFKQPIDLLDLGMIKPRDQEHAMELLRKSNGKNIQFMPKTHKLTFLSPRDEMNYYKKISNATDKNNRDTTNISGKPNRNHRPTWYDFSSMLEKNMANPFGARRIRPYFENKDIKKYPKVDENLMQKRIKNVSDFFQENRFYRKPDNNRSKIHWTSCDEFAKKAVFHPNDVVNTKWLPFFIWSKIEFTSTVIHTFSYPTKKTVQYFRTTYGPYIKNINWNQPKLLLKERRNILLIAGDRKGLFYGVPEQGLSKQHSANNVTLPTITLRMKIHDPYLAMMYCDEHYAIIMAELGTEPTSDHEATLEAGTLKFKGKGHTVYRDIEMEKFLAKMENDKKIENERKKFIQIHRIVPDIPIDI